MKGYKLLRRRRDGTFGPLFIDRGLVLPFFEWLQAGDHPTKGYAHRPGWHILAKKSAPHLSKRGRVWAEVEFEDYEEHTRPKRQGGLWYLAQRMRLLRVLPRRPGMDTGAPLWTEFYQVGTVTKKAWGAVDNRVRERDAAEIRNGTEIDLNMDPLFDEEFM